MTRQSLIEKIESLPPEKRAEVEEIVERLASSPQPEPQAQPMDTRKALVARIRARREQFLKERGLFDLLPLIREFRETGGR